MPSYLAPMRNTLGLMLVAAFAAACEDAAVEADAALPPIRRQRDVGVAPPSPPVRDGGADAAVEADGGDEDAAPPVDGAVALDATPAADLGPGTDAAPPPPDAAPPPDPDAAPPPDLGPPPVGEACRQALAQATFTFEAGPQGWGHAVMDDVAGNWPLDPWELGAAVAGPGACFEGRACWGTDLDDNLVQCQRAEVRSPQIDLSACAGHELVMVFDHWYAFWSGRVDGIPFFDGGTVEAGNIGGFFEVLAADLYPGTIAINPDLGPGYSCLRPNSFYVDGLPGFVGRSDGWRQVRLPLDGLHRGGPMVVRFAYATGVSAYTTNARESQRGQPPGWYIDHVRFEVR